jgi:hypothetical protein
MTIHIDELVVRTVVVEEGGGAQGGSQGGKGAPGADQRDAIVAEAVERVLAILRRREEP